MSTILGSNIHTTKAPWDKVERTKFQGFDVNSYTKDCFGDTFEMNYPSGTKIVDNRGVIHFTKDGCIALNGVIYAGNQCLNVVYEAHTGKRLTKAKDAEDFMYQHADDPHLQVVYFHIYNDSNIVGDQLSNSNSVGTGVFITFGSTKNDKVFSQHYFWNNTHYYRVIASTATDKSEWIKIKDIHKINYDKENHKIQLLGIKNLSTSVKNESGFIGAEVSGAEIPVWRGSSNYPGLFDSTIYNDLNDKVSKCVDRAIYNFDNIVTSVAPNTLKPMSELLNYDGSDTTVKNWLTNDIGSCELNWYDVEKRFLLNLGEYQFPVTENIINDTNPDWDIKGQWYSMYGKPIIYGNTDNYQYNLYRRTFGFDDQSKNWRNGADNIYVICSEGGNTNNNLESLSYILLTETGVQSQLDWLTEKVTQDPVASVPVDLSEYLKKTEFNTYADNWDSTVGLKHGLWNINNAYLPNIIKNFGSYVTKSQLISQSYVTKSQLSAQSYIKSSTLNDYVTKSQLVSQSYIKSSVLNDYVTKSKLTYLSYVTEAYLTSQAYLQEQDINRKLEQYVTSSQFSALNTAYNNLYTSTKKLITSYNLLCKQVAYNTGMIDYLLGLHSGDSSVTPAPTPAPTSAPITAPITEIKIPIQQYSGLTSSKNNVLWGNNITESVSLYLNDESTQLGNTYSAKYITLNNVNMTNLSSYSFDLVISSYLFSGGNTPFETALSNDRGYKLIWPKLNSGNINIDGGSSNIIYRGYGRWGVNNYYYRDKKVQTSIDATGKTISYYMYAKYRSDLSTTKPGSGSAYYTAQFQYVYPYLHGLMLDNGNTLGTTLNPIVNSSVIYGDKTQKPWQSNPQLIYDANNNQLLSVELIDTWSHDNQYFVKYNLYMSKTTIRKFNSGEYKLAFGLHACSPQVFEVDSSFFN